MKQFMKKSIRRAAAVALLAVLGTWAFFAYSAWRADPLQSWHIYVPREMSVGDMESADWRAYTAHENGLFEEVRKQVTERLPEEAKTLMNRYYEGSLVYPPRFHQDWNRSYFLLPEGEPQGAVVLLHGLTDTPYSLRHVARLYARKGFVALGIRLPGHGTVPAGLTDSSWQDWMAATRLAVRESARIAGPDKAVHVVGFSTGGALAVKYALDAMEDTSLRRPDRIVLLSPMVGITRFARFAGLTAVPAILPAFSNAAWLGVLPEFNPFKYNSFPVNGARQSHLLSQALQIQIARLAKTEAFATLAPVLTFQSVLDYTVSTPAVLYHLYAYLPDNGSELHMYDVNQASLIGGLMRAGAAQSLQRMLPRDPQRYTLAVLRNRAPGDQRTMLVTRKAGSLEETSAPLDLVYPKSVFSLSHGAIPFPLYDPLYGMNPSADGAVRYGVNLGNLSLRGERGALLVPMDAMLRMASNPFFPLLLEQVEKGIDNPRPAAGPLAPALPPSGRPAEVEGLFEEFLEEQENDVFPGASTF